MPTLIRHVILDRDGVLNVERSDGRCIANWSQWQWIPRALDALYRLGNLGVRVSIVTNQSAIGRGLATREAIDAVHARMVSEAARGGCVIDHVYVCPHAPEAGCDCRKPAPGLVVRAMAQSRIPAYATMVVGDDLRDLDAARAAGVSAALVRTGKGRGAEAAAAERDVQVFDDLYDFTRLCDRAEFARGRRQ